MLVRILIALVIWAFSLGFLEAEVFMVTNTADDGPGSLRQAILDANTHPNPSSTNRDRIHFAIVGSGIQTIFPRIPLPDITDPIVIDGFSQPGAHPNTNPIGQGLNSALMIELDGNQLIFEGNGFTVTCGNSTVQGLIISRFDSAVMCRGESGNTIEGNYLGTDRTGTFAPRNLNLSRNPQESFGVNLENCANSRVGGRTPNARNLISGGYYADVFIHGVGSTGNVVEGNLMGTKADGLAALDEGSGAGVTLADGASANLVGGAVIQARNVLSSSDSDGAYYIGVYFYPAINGFVPTFGNMVKGNFMGLNVTGKAVTHSDQYPGGYGVFLTGHHNVIGGTESGARNIISGNPGGGILIGGAIEGEEATDNLVEGNFIGTDESGLMPLGNARAAIRLDGLANRNQIGGTEVGAGNRIAFTSADGEPDFTGVGVVLFPFPTAGGRNAILGNCIYGNAKLGIDFNGDGVTSNDPGDLDTGPNNLQNYPVLTSAEFAGNWVVVHGVLDSIPNRLYRIEFFVDSTADSSNFGEGKIYLGAGTVETGPDGMAVFGQGYRCPPGARFVSATATDSDNNTSEFSQAIQVTGTPPPHLLNISTRLVVQTEDSALIGGFIITGIDPKRVLIRAIGPSLSATLSGALHDTTLELFQNGMLLASNDNWKDSQQSDIEATGIPPNNDLESAIVRTLMPGEYTSVLRGRDNTVGIGIVEVYDLDQGRMSQLGNISTRGVVQTGDEVMIGGLVCLPNGGGSVTVVLRAMGPSLHDFGISGALNDPILELRNSDGVVIRSNDNWRDSQAALIIAMGLQPTDDRESALLQVIAPGSYTAVVRGNGNTSGMALVEVYRIE